MMYKLPYARCLDNFDVARCNSLKLKNAKYICIRLTNLSIIMFAMYVEIHYVDCEASKADTILGNL